MSTPLSRMGPPPRSFAADAHDSVMVRPPLDRPNTRLWRDDPRPMASSPLIVDVRLSPTNLSSSLRTVSDGVARGGNRVGWSTRARKQATVPPRQPSDARKAGAKTRPAGSEPILWPGREPSRPKPLDIGRPIKACSGFTRVTACRIAQSPKTTFVTRLRPGGLPRRPLVSYQRNRQLTGWNLPPLVNRAVWAH